jgi:DNA processing protein
MVESLIPQGSRTPSLHELLALQLTAGVGAVTYRKLLRTFGSVQGILAAPASRIEDVEGVGPKRARLLASGQGLDLAGKEAERAASLGIELVSYIAPGYPPALKQIYDPPLVLFVRGRIVPEDALALGVVGARNCSIYGRQQGERFAGALAGMGFTIVSGLARGIDSAAHKGALDAGGRTLALMGCGLAGVYPRENVKLAERIAEHGAVISELPADAPPTRESFPRRNRLISGMSLGVLIVEGSKRSGSLITARCALEQGREVFAIPGRIDNVLASGPNSLIKTAGAKLVESAHDVLDELGPVADDLVGLKLETALSVASGAGAAAGESGSNVCDMLASGLNSKERTVFESLGKEPQQVDMLIERSGLPPAEIASILMVLEIRRLAKRLPGQRYMKAVN